MNTMTYKMQLRGINQDVSFQQCVSKVGSSST